MHPEDLDEIFLNSFLKEFQQTQQQTTQQKQEARIIAEKKQQKLTPIRDFLQKFVDLGVQVHHADYYDKSFTTDNYYSQLDFDFYESTSSKSWHPGISVIIEHPATIEIAVPNSEEEGLFVVNISTEHPDSFVLKQKFVSVAQLCQALAIFIQKNTVSVDKNPLDEINSLENKVRFDGSTIRNKNQRQQEKENQSLYNDEINKTESSPKKFEKYFNKNKNSELE